jgi:hypothetical protein
VKRGSPAFWITLNPNDLTINLFCILAGKEITNEMLFELTDEEKLKVFERKKLVSMNPSIAAGFFDTVIEAYFQHLVLLKNMSNGIFGKALH